MMSYRRWPVGRGLLRMVFRWFFPGVPGRLLPGGVALGLVLAGMLAGCRSAPDEDILPELVDWGVHFHQAPADGTELATDEVRLVISPGTLDIGRVQAVVLRLNWTEPDPDMGVIAGDFEKRKELLELADQNPPLISFLLPLEGVPQGAPVRVGAFLELQEGALVPVKEPFTVTFELSLPQPGGLQEELLTIDPRPVLSWARDEAISAVEISLAGEREILVPGDGPGDDQVSLRPSRDILSSGELLRGGEFPWRLRSVSPRGVRGPWSEAGLIRYDLTESVPVSTGLRSGDRTVVSRPALVWAGVDGTSQYHLEYYLESEEHRLEGLVITEESRHRFSGEEAEFFSSAGAGATLRWRLRGENLRGTPTPWSDYHETEHLLLISALEPLIHPGAEAQVLLGAPRGTPGARPDEMPQVPVVLDGPLGVARTPLTVEAVAELFNQGLRSGELSLSGGRLVEVRQEVPLLALEGLDFGSQFGLREEVGATQGESRLGVVPGYRSHPAVGITWFGAVWLMNRLSLLEGRDQAYEIRGDEVFWDPRASGYRLPTEAEWALAAAARRRLPREGWAEPLVVFRELSSRDLRNINFLRSGDAWEDPLPPYTRAGGPTSPVGALTGAAPAGVQDLLGNVWEWCWDWYSPERGIPLPRNYAGPEEPAPDLYGRVLRVVRGGAWNTPREGLRPTMRGAFAPAAASHSIGVRPARGAAEYPPGEVQ
ncbi:Sulfatase-modifying factor enzyme 1 [Alkalispirochaeta americana]|uniref:Sulfatase-modifying factor enzyme 1 n=1 Tax=Alkalispirochaeta americana TaxID=159291 RepID=A0A1N6NBY3_9SPIO|nr:formylglycine-generating enzyme family protein [Alkalispirochaeta americana]SIP89581.1 Sulfatase-modifying factor enzyme 1 [Alkalispirochaeta americana]